MGRGTSKAGGGIATNKSETRSIYESVKTVNGHKIERLPGTHGAYHVEYQPKKGVKARRDFKTIKAATEFAKSL